MLYWNWTLWQNWVFGTNFSTNLLELFCFIHVWVTITHSPPVMTELWCSGSCPSDLCGLYLIYNTLENFCHTRCRNNLILWLYFLWFGANANKSCILHALIYNMDCLLPLFCFVLSLNKLRCWKAVTNIWRLIKTNKK